MRKVHYTRSGCPKCPDNYNGGERLEWQIGYELTGTPNERNNKPAESGGDVGRWQVKSPKASLTDRDNCDGYIFGFPNETYFFEMSIQEFESFINEFSYLDYDSKTKKPKVRIKNDSKKMRKWLEDRA
jgi:hypothetical protein